MQCRHMYLKNASKDIVECSAESLPKDSVAAVQKYVFKAMHQRIKECSAESLPERI